MVKKRKAKDPKITVRFSGEPDRERTIQFLRELITKANAYAAAKKAKKTAKVKPPRREKNQKC